VDNGCSDCISCFEIKIGADTPKFTNHECKNSRIWIVQIFGQRK